MHTTTITEEMRLMSAGRAFLWGVNERHDSILVELDASADPRSVESEILTLERGGPSMFLLWNGSELADLVDAEEAAFVAQHTILDRRHEPAEAE